MNFHKNDSYFESLIRRCDLFGRPLQLFLNQNSKYKSILGGWCTILLLSIILIFAMMAFISSFTLSTITESNRQTYSNNPGILNLTHFNFMFAFGFNDPRLLKENKSLIEFELKIASQTRSEETGEINRTYFNIDIVKCSEEHFKLAKNNFKIYKLNNYFCPNISSNFIISGGYNNDFFQYVNLKITKCLNSSKCANLTEIDDFFIKNEIDSANIEKPFSQSIKSDLSFLISPLLYKMADIFLSEVKISTSYMFLPYFLKPQIKELKSYFYLDEKNEQATLMDQKNVIADFYLRKSYKIFYYKRTFGSVVEIISFIGGLWAPLFFFLNFIIGKYNDFCYLIHIANSLFSFPSKENNKKINSSNTKRKTNEDTNVKSILHYSTMWNNKTTNSLFSIDLLKEIKNYFQNTHEIHPNYKDFFIFFPISKTFSKRKKLLNLAKNEAKNYLNVSKMILKLKELDRLKNLFLTEEQHQILQFYFKKNIMKKRIINNNRENIMASPKRKKKKKSTTTPISMNSFLQFSHLFNMINGIQESKDINDVQNKLNKKLITLIYNEIIQSLDDVNKRIIEFKEPIFKISLNNHNSINYNEINEVVSNEYKESEREIKYSDASSIQNEDYKKSIELKSIVINNNFFDKFAQK